MDATVLPRIWSVVTLNDVAQSIGGSTPSKSDASFWVDGTVPWVSPKDMKVFDLRASEDLVSQKALARLSLIPEGSILVVVRSGILSRLFPVAINHLPVTINQDMRAFVLATEINARFIAWQLLANQREILAKCSKDGTTVASIEAVALATYPLALPPAAEQHRIVAKIEELFSELDQGVASLKTAREQLKVYRQSLLKSAFEGKLTADWRAAHRDQLESAVALQQRIARERQTRYQQQLVDWQAAGQVGSKPKAPKPLPPLTAEELAELPELPEGWGWVKLGSLIDDPDYGTSKKCDYKTDGVGVLRIPNVASGKVDVADLKFAKFSLDEIAAYQLAAGDLLMIRSNGSVSIVGKCALVSQQDTAYLYAGYLIRLRSLQRLVLPAYLAQLLSSHESRKQIEYKAKSTSGVNNINSGEIQSLVVPLCGLKEQELILAELESKLSEADQLDQTLVAALQQADALRQSILKKAFCGQLVAQDANDEPATVLLERIRAERAKAGNQKSGRSR